MSDILTQQRHDKLKKLKDVGLDPYPQPNLESKDSCQQALNSFGKKVTVAGRLMLLRGHGKILFADLHDRTGKIQLFFQEKVLGKQMDQTKLLDIGDVISAVGEVIKTQAGEITVNVSDFHILAKNLRPLPEKWHGLTDVEERYRQRYVDLIVNPEVRQVFVTRTKILSEMRRFFDDHGFMEVETPVLQPVYGGASAKPFITHHENLDQDMYLRISDELYLKRLIVGGFEKVYEVSRDFRNEGVSRFHNPEFTQIEFYWAYVDYDVLMKFTEELIIHIIKLIKGSLKFSFQGQELDFTPPFKRQTFREAILEKTGIDINLTKTEATFLDLLKAKNIKLDLKDAIGLGAMYDALYKELVRPFLIGPVYITDYPAEMIALAKRKTDDPTKIASFQLLTCGIELLKAYNELNDPADQRSRWLDEEVLAKKGAVTAMQLDEDYIRALEYGMPPTSGWGMGIDRFTQFLTDQSTLKDVILFPTMRNESFSPKKYLSDDQTAVGFQNPNVVIGEVVGIKDHPNADSLKIFDVKIGPDKTYSVISSCNNVVAGNTVPLALLDAVLHAPDNKTLKLKKTRMRGIESSAMMCSSLELGLGDDHTGIHILPDNLRQFLGQPVKDHLKK
jgi:lysyl-tRNA synthetase, class II